jgi:hypothetical protein
MMLLIVNELSFVTSSTLLNSQYYSKTLTQVGYYDHLRTEIEKGLINIGLATGLPKEVFENSIDRQWLELQGNYYIASLIDYLSLKSATIRSEFDSKPLEAKLNQTIVSYAKQTGMPIAKEDLTSLNALLINNVQQRIIVVDPQNPIFLSLRKFTAMIVLGRGYLVFASLLILLCLFLVNKNEPYKFIDWLAYSFISTGFFIVIPSFILRISSVLNRFALNDIYLRQAVGAILERFVSYTLYTGLATITVGLLLVFASYKAPHSNNPQLLKNNVG